MPNNDSRRKWIPWYRRSPIRFDVLLFIFLFVGWSLIYTAATFGLDRVDLPWLPVSILSQVSADYSVKLAGEPKLARMDPEIIEAVRRDQNLRATPTVPALALAVTPTSTPEFTATPEPAVSILNVSAGGPYRGQEGSEIELVARNSGSMLGLIPGAVTYLWDLNNDGRYDDASGASTAVLFHDEGVYTISVRATDLLGQVGLDSVNVTVSNIPPSIVMGNDLRGKENEEVIFLATGSDPGNDILLYEWDFGDGTPKVTDTLNPRHTYLDDGDYIVRLRVNDNDGGVSEASIMTEIENLPPIADSGPDQMTNEASILTFSGTAEDPSPLDPLTYDWDFDYDGRTFTPDATGPIVSTIYPNGPASIVAALRVRDKDDGLAIDTIRVMVRNVPPVITGVSNDGPAGEGSPLSLSVSATDVGKDLLNYAFDWQDNGSFDLVGQSNTVENIWDNQGDYRVRIRVDDGDGGQAFITTTVSAFNEPPLAVAAADTNRLEGSPVAFSGIDSSDPGINDVLTYQWNFGDGSGGNGVNASHIYGDNSVYSATLTVSDDSGAVSTASVPTTILNANPTANAGPDLAVDECRRADNNSYDCSNIPLNFSGIATDPGTADILTYEWDFDYQNGAFNQDASSATGTYLYPNLDGPMDYMVALRVRDDDYNPNPAGGAEIGEALDTLKLTVKNLPPWNVNAGGPYTGVETEVLTLLGTAEDAPADAPSLAYSWDLNSNPDFETSGNQVTYAWNTAGNYTIRLRVRDKDGAESFASAQVTIGNALPHAEANGPYTSTVSFPVTLSSAGSSDPINDPLIYNWNFGDGSPIFVITDSAVTTVTHLYLDDGIYTATLQVDDRRGGFDTDTALVTIQNLPPIAVASATPNPVIKGAVIAFNGSSSTDPDDNPASLIYQWDFGDGSPVENGINVSHTYTSRGAYNAVLTVTDDDGAADQASIAVTVNNSRPTAVIVADQTVDEGEPVAFDGSNSSDPNPGDSLTYQWNFGDGSPLANGANVSYTYANGPATYLVTLTVRDTDGATDNETHQITVNNVTPTAAAGPDQTVDEGEPVTFDGSGSSVPNGNLTYQWDFGDGSPVENGINASHTYPDGPATFVVTLTVTDNDGDTSTDTAQITVNNVTPTAAAGPNQTVDEGSSVTFDGSGSTDPGADTLTYQWDFGDGSPLENGINVSHTYPDGPATFDVTLTVTDNDGNADTDTVQVNVNNLDPTASIAADQITVAVDQDINFDAGGSTDPGADTLTYQWDFGDGATDNGLTVNHSWTIAGTYTIILQVDDGQGGSDTDTISVEVN